MILWNKKFKIFSKFLNTRRATCPIDPQKVLFRGSFYKVSLKWVMKGLIYKKFRDQGGNLFCFDLIFNYRNNAIIWDDIIVKLHDRSWCHRSKSSFWDTAAKCISINIFKCFEKIWGFCKCMEQLWSQKIKKMRKKTI